MNVSELAQNILSSIESSEYLPSHDKEIERLIWLEFKELLNTIFFIRKHQKEYSEKSQ